MRTRFILRLIVVFDICGCFITNPVWASQVKRNQTRPNILFIFTDDQSHRTVGCYPEAPAWVKTPNIDRLADEGVLFSAAYPAGAWCLPSRATVLTGRLPHAIHGLKIEHNPFGKYDPKVCRFWPAELRKAGYCTAVIGKWHLSEDTGHGRDWDHSIIWNHAAGRKAGNFYVEQNLRFDGGPFESVGGYSTDNYTRFAEKFIKREHDRPWLLWLCYDAPHGPFTVPVRYQYYYRENAPVPVPVDIYPPRSDKPTYMHNFCTWKAGAGKYEGQPVCEVVGKTQSLAEWVRQYNRSILAVDEGVGRLMAALKESGQLDNTFVVFTSDQGHAIGQHGFMWKMAPYDDNLRVPLIIRMPERVAQGKVCHHPVGTLDVVATFFKLAEIDPPWKMHGHDLSGLLKDVDSPWRHPVMLEFTRWEMGHETDRGLTGDADFNGVPWWIFLRQGKYKYIRTLVPDEIEELYNLKRDPLELKNLAVDPAYRDTLADYRQRMIKELKRTDAGLINSLPEPRIVDFARKK